MGNKLIQAKQCLIANEIVAYINMRKIGFLYFIR